MMRIGIVNEAHDSGRKVWVPSAENKLVQDDSLWIRRLLDASVEQSLGTVCVKAVCVSYHSTRETGYRLWVHGCERSD